MQLPRWLLWLTISGVLLATVGVTALVYWLVKPAPPRELVMSAGPPHSDYFRYAQKYVTALAREGVTLWVETSEGSPENIIRLGDPSSAVEVAFFQGGTGYSINSPGVVSLGSLYYEPVWVFYRGDEIEDLPKLAGKRIAIGSDASGSRALALQLLAVNGVVLPPTELLPIGGVDGAQALLTNRTDALFLVAAPDLDVVQQLLSHPEIRLLTFERADAYTRRFPYLTKLILPRGVVDFAGNIPARDITLIAPTASLLARESMHPALATLLLKAAREIHGGAGLFNQAREFPNMTNADFPFPDEVRRAYTSGVPFLQRHLPFWLANLIERMWFLVLPAFAVAIPLMRAIPPLLRWWRRSRIYRWYARLKEIELQLERQQDTEALRDMLVRLDEIDHAVSSLPTPLAYSENVYNFRSNIAFVRARVRTRIEDSLATSPNG